MIDAWFDFVDRINWIVVFGVTVAVFVFYVIWNMQRNKNSKFDFAEMFEGADGRTSMGQFWAFVGGATTTFIVGAMAMLGSLTDTMFSLYIITLVAGKVASQAVTAMQMNGNKGESASPANENQAVGTLQLEVPLSTPASPQAKTVDDVAPRRPLGKRRS
jgi:hypothetical protein